MRITAAQTFRVGDWLVESGLLQISKDGKVRKLEFMTMEILLCMVSMNGDVVSRKKLHDEVWRDVYVTDNAITRGVSKLRKVFDDDPLKPKYIETISKSGYRLIAPVDLFPESKGDKQTSPVVPSLRITAKTRLWLWGLLAVSVISGLSLANNLTGNDYTAFYDPVPVSTLVGQERGLSISPNGEKMSFSYSEPGANNSDVYIKLLNDLSQVKFTTHASHQGYGIWSPDENYLAYVSTEDGSCGIYMEPSIGGEKTRIGDCYSNPEDFTWSPDGKTIAFTDYKPGKQTRSIFFLNVDTRVCKEVLTSDNGMSDRDPAFSPKGDYLVFRRGISNQGSDIYKINIANKELTRISWENSRILGLDIFDEGKQIAFSSDRGGTWAMWKMPFDGGTITRFNINDRVPTEPRFSADGKRMIYRSIRDQTRIWAIEKKESEYNGSFPVASSTRTEIHPSLSSDGNKMVFISNRSGQFEIWLHNFDNNTSAKLTSLKGGFVNMPSWSTDGSEVVFDARIAGDNALYILDVASKLIRTFVDLEGDQVNARYSKNGKYIYFGSNHSGTWQVWKKSVFHESADIIQVTPNGGYYLHEGPGDGYLYFTKSDTSGLWRIEEGGYAKEEQFISDLSTIDWGNWVPVRDGIIYINRNFGPQICLHPYSIEETPVCLFSSSKRIQSWNPSLSTSMDGNKIVFVQIEYSEDEIMLVNFR